MRLGTNALYMLPNVVPKHIEALLEAFGQVVSSYSFRARYSALLRTWVEMRWVGQVKIIKA